jgi:hypothetical protein
MNNRTQTLAEDKTLLKLDENNELFFKINIQGADRGPEAVRLVCEAGDMSYYFKGKATNEDGIVRFVVPPMKDSAIVPGELYDARVEVIIDDHYFVPVRFKTEFKQPMKVFAESVTPMSKNVHEISSGASTANGIKISAQSVSAASYASLREKYKNEKGSK